MIFFSGLYGLSHAWDYTSLGTDWPDDIAACEGSNQSPINIVKDEAISASPTHSLRIACASVTGKFVNEDGNILKFELPDGKALVSPSESLTGGPFDNVKYYFHHFVLHWGNADCEGSEHTVDFNRCNYYNDLEKYVLLSVLFRYPA